MVRYVWIGTMLAILCIVLYIPSASPPERFTEVLRAEHDITRDIWGPVNNVKDVTVYTFLYPILGGDSPEKAKNIWCAKDNTKAWRDWMLDGTTPPKTMGQCDIGALNRNAEMGRKYKINGTPAIVFEDGKRVPGAMNAEQLEKQLVASRSARP